MEHYVKLDALLVHGQMDLHVNSALMGVLFVLVIICKQNASIEMISYLVRSHKVQTN